MAARLAAADWNVRVSLIRRVPEAFGTNLHRDVYARIADRVYVPNLVPDFAYVHWRADYELPHVEEAYRWAHSLTNGFTRTDVETLTKAITTQSRILLVFRLLLGLTPREETPARTPWWLTLLRLTLAALVILAAAGPLWNPPLSTSTAAAPIALLVDDGWAAAATWDARLRTADDIITRAENDRRPVALIPLSEGTRDISFAPAASARVRLQLIKPKPHTVDRTEAMPVIARFLNAISSHNFDV